MKTGICKLCGKSGTLEKSHFNPAAVYKIFDSPQAPNRNPILVTSKAVVQTSKQVTDYAFCGACEDRFDVGGEKWFLPLLPKDSSAFPLYDLLDAVPPDCIEGNTAMYAASRNPEIRVQELAHFGLGMFWRGTHHWSCKDYTPLDLGPYGDKIAAFLLGKSGFPEDVVLYVTVLPPPLRVMVSYLPIEVAKTGMVHNFSYYVPGVHLLLSVGKEIGAEERELCFYRNPLHPISVSDVTDMVEWRPKKQYFASKKKMAERVAR